MKNINRLLLAVLVLTFILASCEDSSSPQDTSNVTINKDEAYNAFEYLNEFRADPESFGALIGLNLSDISPVHELNWNSTLASVAEAKARDLAAREYFAHVDPDGNGINILIHRAGYTLPDAWIAKPSMNNFESLAANSKSGITGKEFIDQLIIDQGVPDFGHRKHLLGVGDWFGSLVDIGIGMAYGPDSYYKNYMCIIIARRN